MADIIYPLDSKMKAELLHRRETGLKKGKWAGWRDLYEHYTVKTGSTTYVVAPPAVGKTAVIYELTMNLAEFEGQKVVIFTPETGAPIDVYNELLWAYLRQPFLKHNGGDATEKQINQAIDFVKEHFYVLDPMYADLNSTMYFQAIDELQESTGEKIDIAVIDPITDMVIEGTARDLALGSFLTKVRKYSSGKKIHTFVAFHTRVMAMEIGEDIYGNKRRYYPPPTMGDVAGGEMASRKGMFILGLWRPPYQVIDNETNLPFIANESRLEILKAKPKAVGKLGVIKLYYDAYSSRYYELDEDGKPVYSYAKPPDIK